MSINGSRLLASWRSNAGVIGVMLAIVFVGATIGLLLAALGVVLAPPWTFLTSLLYLPMACLGLPVWILAGWMRWLKPPGLLGALMGAGIVAFFYLAILGPWLPRGMTNCQSMMTASPQVRYICVSTSSDDTDYRYEFTLEGWEGWPVMRLIQQNR
jgi:hypothetical protein